MTEFYFAEVVIDRWTAEDPATVARLGHAKVQKLATAQAIAAIDVFAGAFGNGTKFADAEDLAYRAIKPIASLREAA